MTFPEMGPSRGVTSPYSLAFIRSLDARLVVISVRLSALERKRLQQLLGILESSGHIILPRTYPVTTTLREPAVLTMLEDWLSPDVVGAALGASKYPFIPSPAPAAVIPVWEFEPVDGDDVLLATAQLWGSDLLIEALRVRDDEEPQPIGCAEKRFSQWRASAGGDGDLKTVRIPGRAGAYVLFAASHPA